MIRLFAAIAVPDDVAAALAPLQQGLHEVRWRPREAMHVTLRFFGDIAEPLADELDAQLEGVGGAPFDLTLQGAGCFGAGRHIRAIWAGLAESEPLRQLAARCESAARRAGLTPETRNYAPHVTLAYLKRPDPAEIARWVAGHNLLKAGPFRVDRFGLYSSWSSRSGSIYRLEREYPLAG